jgi:hypothetical protein
MFFPLEPVSVDLLRSPQIDSQLAGLYDRRTLFVVFGSIGGRSRFLGYINVYKYGLRFQQVSLHNERGSEQL